MTITRISDHLRTCNVSHSLRMLAVNMVHALAKRAFVEGARWALSDTKTAIQIVSLGPGKKRDALVEIIFDTNSLDKGE